jgi:transcriptional regulator with GAF, ATPase, and Fis domain
VRLFFAMCVVTMAAFVGGFHWWVISGSLLLDVPFAACAVLVPVVTLHFFLAYPQPMEWVRRFPRFTMAALYAIPAATIVGVTVLLVAVHLHAAGDPASDAAPVRAALALLRNAVYGYLTLAALYFLATLGALVHGFFATHNALEHAQVKWILGAGLVATIPLGYSLSVAHFDRTGFALGAARVPMFLASLSFMLAYAVAIVRHKLILVDRHVGRGIAYYVASTALAAGFALATASAALLPQVLNVSLSWRQALQVAAIVGLSVMLLLWLRDRIQQLTDRRFFREKYQLDKALERMNRAVGHLADPRALGERMLSSCQDVLRTERAALYLQAGAPRTYRLVASADRHEAPLQIVLDEPCAAALAMGGTLQRVPPESRDEVSPVQKLLVSLRADLIHVLESEGELVGFVALGHRGRDASFSAEDLTFLTALCQITNVALQGAKAHQQLSRLNEELRSKTERVESQRRQIAMLQAELGGRQAADPPPAEPPPAADFRRDAVRGSSPAIQGLLETVRKVATSESTVLLRGESGTGKELLAQVLHDNSPRRAGPLVRVHCASLAPSLLESELFGHVKGAFTGAHQDRIGRFEAAHGGTLFLDEIGDISLETQVKLLRVLQERCFEPVGSTRTVRVDVRLVTGTHQNLERQIAEGRFREDLYYRLNVISLTLPPLRERGDDVLELAVFFLTRAAERVGKRVSGFDEEALGALETYAWPGNVRELQNVVERAVVLAEEGRITLRDLPAEIGRIGDEPPRGGVLPNPARSSLVLPSANLRRTGPDVGTEPAAATSAADRAAERRMLLDALRRCGGNKASAARLLGMPRSTYFSKLRKHGLDA